MTKAHKTPHEELSVLDAIYRRRATRSFTPDVVDEITIRALLSAAIQAPNAMHEEPWAFTIIQDKEMLRELSESAKEETRKDLANQPAWHPGHASKRLTDPDFNIFYDAGTLVVIWAKPMGQFSSADCWLAAENLMLAACGMGLGSCVIGFSLPGLNTPEWKRRLGVHEKMTPVAPIILGVPDKPMPPVPRNEPDILSWQ